MFVEHVYGQSQLISFSANICLVQPKRVDTLFGSTNQYIVIHANSNIPLDKVSFEKSNLKMLKLSNRYKITSRPSTGVP